MFKNISFKNIIVKKKKEEIQELQFYGEYLIPKKIQKM